MSLRLDSADPARSGMIVLLPLDAPALSVSAAVQAGSMTRSDRYCAPVAGALGHALDPWSSGRPRDELEGIHRHIGLPRCLLLPAERFAEHRPERPDRRGRGRRFAAGSEHGLA